MNDDEEQLEILYRLRYTRKQLERYRRIMSEMSADNIAKMTDEELTDFSKKLFED